MNEITLLGIDLAKNVFHLQGSDKHHKVMLKKRLSRRPISSIEEAIQSAVNEVGSLATAEALGHLFKQAMFG